MLCSAVVCCVSAVHAQEVGDKNQLVARLTEQISEAEAAHQAAKQQRNAAQDVRKDAWRKDEELKDQAKKTEAEYTKAFNVGGASSNSWQLHSVSGQPLSWCAAVWRGLCRGAQHGAEC